ncbi:replication initiation protein RepM (plasmid) [Moraxella osloensis]|nr:replication initiation protein RepM [Moraxella osloensis]QRO12256.1 replication initiation protein RepM [Moraxella osloensis]
MSELEVVKKNRLNECMQNLTLSELRLMQLAIVDFRNKSEFDEKAIVEIHANTYAETFNVSRQTAHEIILQAEKTLFQRQFTYINDEGKTVKSRWIGHVEYSDNSIKIGLSVPVIDAISRIDGKETPFTRYHIEQTHTLTSRYSLRLYELVIQYLKIGKTPVFELKKFRFQLGLLPTEYEKMSNFKKKVLDLAVNEISEKTNITVSYEQKKQGKVIVGFIFTVNEKRKEKDVTPKTTDNNNGDYWLNDKQVNYFASLLSKDPALGNHCPIGMDEAQFAIRLASELKGTAEQRAFLKPYLVKHGFDMKSALSQPPTSTQEPVVVDDRASKIYKTVEPVPTAPVDIVEKQKQADKFLSNLENVLKNKSLKA